jgi:hypothetical protein
VQLRLAADGPKVFEINRAFQARSLRDKLGFHDFIWSLLGYVGLLSDPISPLPAYGCTAALIIIIG